MVSVCPQGQSDKSWWGEAPGDTQQGMPMLSPGRERWQASRAEVCGDRLSEHPPCFPGGLVQPAVSSCGCMNTEGRADTALLLREAGAHSVPAGVGWSCRPVLTPLVNQCAATAPRKPVRGHCPQRLSAWMSLLCRRGRAAQVPEGLLCFTCKLCHELQLLLGNRAAPFNCIAIDRPQRSLL